MTQAYSPFYAWENKRSEFDTLQRAMARGAKWGRFGERKCFGCGGMLIAQELHKSYELHHEFKKASPNYNLLVFVHLVHGGCHRQLGTATEKAPETRKEERENQGEGFGGPDHSDASAYVIQKNADEDMVRETVIEHIMKFGPDPDFSVLYALQLKNVINSVAEEFDYSQATLYRYFARMTNPINGFLWQRSKSKVTFLGFRYQEYYSMDPKEIIRRHPKRGQLFRKESG